MFHKLFQTNDDLHDHNTYLSERLHIPYGKSDVKSFCLKKKPWN